MVTGTDGYKCTFRWYRTASRVEVVQKEFLGLKNTTGRAYLADAMSAYEKGTALPRHVDDLGGGLLEIRTNVGNNHFRTIFFHPRPYIAVALKVFFKNQQKTPQNMIDVARERRGDWLSREGT